MGISRNAVKGVYGGLLFSLVSPVQYGCDVNYVNFKRNMVIGISIWWRHQATIPDSKVVGANMGPNWGRRNPGGPHVGPMWATWTLLSGMS